jgi:hypothetical protein
VTPPNDHLRSWKDQPPKTPEEAAAANLLQEIRSMPSLSPEALARVELRVRANARRRAAQRLPLFAGLRPAVLAGALCLAMVVGGLTFVATERSRSRLAPSNATLALAPSPAAKERSANPGFGAPAGAPEPAAAAPPAELATREWSQPPPDVAELRRNRQQAFNGLGGLGSLRGGAVAPHHASAEKAKKGAQLESTGLGGHGDGFAAGPERRAEDGAVADLADESIGTAGSAAPAGEPEAHHRMAHQVAPAPTAPPSSLGMGHDLAPKDDFAEAASAAPEPESSRAFASPPPPAAAPMGNAAADTEAQFAMAKSARPAAPAAVPNDELQVRRGERLARDGRCQEAIVAFSPTADRAGADPLVERALFGRAGCRLTLGQDAAGRQDLETYLSRFPAGRFVAEARALLR